MSASVPWQPSTAYPYAGGHPPEPAKPKQTLSVVAFVLGVLGCVPLASVAAIVVGAVALAKERAGRAFAVAGIVLGALWTLAGVTLVLTDAPQRFADSIREPADDLILSVDGEDTVWDLTDGSCYNEVNVEEWDDTGPQLSIVDCAQPHEFEVYHETRLGHIQYPGDDSIFAMADSACYVKFTSFVGRPYSASDLDYTFWAPDEITWAEGDRLIQCVVTDGPATVGSLEGARR